MRSCTLYKISLQITYSLFKRLNAFKGIFQIMFFLKYDHSSSNINEVIRAIFRLLYSNISQAQKAQNAYKQIKIKNASKKHLRGK